MDFSKQMLMAMTLRNAKPPVGQEPPPLQEATPEQLKGPPKFDFYAHFKPSSDAELAKVVPPLVPSKGKY